MIFSYFEVSSGKLPAITTLKEHMSSMWPQHSAFSPSMCSNIYLDIDFSRLNDVDKYYIWPKISRNICGSRDSQGRRTSQCHRAMALVVFCPAPNFRAYIERPVTKSLETPNWHWLILFSMGALEYHSIISTVGPRTVFRVCIFFLILGRLNFHYLFDLQWELGLALGISIVFCFHVHSCAEENWQI